jgi:cytochrome b
MTRLKLKLVSIHLKIVLIMTQDGCTVYAKRTIGLEIVLCAPELLCDVGHVKSRFSLFGDSVSVITRYNTVCAKHRNHFGHTRWFSKVMWVLWNLVLVRL